MRRKGKSAGYGSVPFETKSRSKVNALNFVTASWLCSIVSPIPLGGRREGGHRLHHKISFHLHKKSIFGRIAVVIGRMNHSVKTHAKQKSKHYKGGVGGGWYVTSVPSERALLSPIRQERGRRSAASAVFCFLFSMESAASSKKFCHIFRALM